MLRTLRTWVSGAPVEENRRDNDSEELPDDDELEATEEAVPTIEQYGGDHVIKQDNDSDGHGPNTAVSAYNSRAIAPPARERCRSLPLRTSPYGQRNIRSALEEYPAFRSKLATANSRDLLQRRLDRANAGVIRRDERVADIEAEFEEAQEDNEFLRVQSAIVREELAEARRSRSRSRARRAGVNAPPSPGWTEHAQPD